MILSKLSLTTPQDVADSLKLLKQELLTCFATTWNSGGTKPPLHIIMTGSSILYMLELINRQPTDINVILLVEKGFKEETLFAIIKNCFDSNYKYFKFTSRPHFANISIFFTNKESVELTIDLLIQEVDKDNLPPMLKVNGLTVTPISHIFATKKILNPEKYYRDLTDITKTISQL